MSRHFLRRAGFSWPKSELENPIQLGGMNVTCLHSVLVRTYYSDEPPSELTSQLAHQTVRRQHLGTWMDQASDSNDRW